MLLTLAVCWTVALCAYSVQRSETLMERWVIIGFGIGLFVYNGIGASVLLDDGGYTVRYMAFLAAFLIAFRVVARALVMPTAGLVSEVNLRLSNLERSKGWGMVIPFYVALLMLPLVFPVFRLDDLVNPAAPDLRSAFALRFGESPGTSLAEYISLLVAPFALIAVYRYRRHLWLVFFALLAPVYIQFVVLGYVGRAQIAVTLLVFALGTWQARPSMRAQLTVGVALAIPVVLLGAAAYGLVRGGGDIQSGVNVEAVSRLATTEVSFPVVAGKAVVASDERARLPEYVAWIATLPIPSVLKGVQEGGEINYQIAEIALGQDRNTYGWYVVLSGLVAEAVYLFGGSLFWIHALVFGAASALVVRLVDRSPKLAFLAAYVVLVISFWFNRGGVASALPILVNGLVAFYVWVLWPRLVGRSVIRDTNGRSTTGTRSTVVKDR